MTLRLVGGLLFRDHTPVTANYVYYLGRTRLRLEVVWHLAFGEWPNGHVESEDGSGRASSLKIVLMPEKYKGRFVR